MTTSTIALLVAAAFGAGACAAGAGAAAVDSPACTPVWGCSWPWGCSTGFEESRLSLAAVPPAPEGCCCTSPGNIMAAHLRG